MTGLRLVVFDAAAHGWDDGRFAAGVGFNVGVLSGAHNRDLLNAEPHTHLLGSVAELPAAFAT